MYIVGAILLVVAKVTAVDVQEVQEVVVAVPFVVEEGVVVVVKLVVVV